VAGTRENKGGKGKGEETERESCEGGRRMRDVEFFNDFLVPF
jgi:hypothetical protein